MSRIRAFYELEGQRLTFRENFNKYSGFMFGLMGASIPVIAAHGLVSLLRPSENWEEEAIAWGISTIISIPLSAYIIKKGLCIGLESACDLYENRLESEYTEPEPDKEDPGMETIKITDNIGIRKYRQTDKKQSQ